jgi:hypothetical protein
MVSAIRPFNMPDPLSLLSLIDLIITNSFLWLSRIVYTVERSP